MAEIDLEMALMSMMSHGEMNDLHSLIRLLPLVSLAADKAHKPWKDMRDSPAMLPISTADNNLIRFYWINTEDSCLLYL